VERYLTARAGVPDKDSPPIWSHFYPGRCLYYLTSVYLKRPWNTGLGWPRGDPWDAMERGDLQAQAVVFN
jgi:hypothetical protein